MEKDNKKNTNLESVSSIEKILEIQKLLNKLNSVKRLFKENKDKMVNKLYLNSKSYFENKVKIKEVFDTNKIGEQMTYTLVDKPEQSLASYQSLYDFYFLIRNDHLLLLNIIEKADKTTYEELSYFLVHFLYENITNESYTENKLMIMIYLLLEKIIIKDLPDSIDEKNENISSTFLNDTFIYYVNKNLTRKLGVRKFLNDILKSFILRMENRNQFLTVEISMVNQFLEQNQSKRESAHEKKRRSVQLKRTNAFKSGENDNEEFFEVKEIIENEIENKIKEFKKRNKNNKVTDDKIEITPLNEMDVMAVPKTQIIRKKKGLEELEETDIDVYKFFNLFNITSETLNNKLKKYEKSIFKSNCNLAMIEYIKKLIKEFETLRELNKNENNNPDDNEIFSNSLIIEELDIRKESAQKDSFMNLIEKIKKNYFEIKKIINGIIEKIKNNLISSPNYIKYLSRMIYDLLRIKYNKQKKNELSRYQLYKFELNFLIGNIIIPILKNPDFNGLISTDVISEYTRNNTKLISFILEKMIKGSLFKKSEDSYMTIFNIFIIDTTPKLFELVDIIEKQFKTPDIIKDLLNDCNNNNSVKRNIEYDYFKEYPDENIDYQNICIYNLISYYLSSIITKNKDIFVEQNQNNQQKSIIEKFIGNQEEFNKKFKDQVYNKKQNYFNITKILYSNEFNNKNKVIVKDNFNRKNKSEENAYIKAFKICLMKLFNYLISIKRLNLADLIGDKIFGKSFNRHDSFTNLDFQKVIFPKIKRIISLEINKYNESNASKQIAFYINYLDLYFNKIPDQYKKNNYSLLFDELIHEIKDKIEYLNADSLVEFHQKLTKAKKAETNIIKYCSEIKNLIFLKSVEYLYDKIKVKGKFIITKYENIILSIEYKEPSNCYHQIKKINEFPDFHKYEEEYDSILEIEENAKVHQAIFNFWNSIKKVIREDKKFNKFNVKEIKDALINYIFKQIHNMILPFEPSNVDFFLNKKCQRLSFLQPENVIEKNIINSKFLEQATKIIKKIEKQITPFDMVKCIMDALNFLRQCNSFFFGIKNSSYDDTDFSLNYIIIKSNPKNLNSIYEYCSLFDKILEGKEKSELADFINIIDKIKKSKLNFYLGISEEEYGIDEFDESGNPIENH